MAFSINTFQSISNNNNLIDFDSAAIDVFNFQYDNNPFYKTFCDIFNKNPANVRQIVDIPFLPIQFFKSKEIKTTSFAEQTLFESSGTTGSINSKHFVKDTAIYEQSYINGFRKFYGNENEYCIIGLLPSYLERQNSSLVYMVDDLIKKSNHENSGFYLYNFEELKNILKANELAKQKTLLIGVTYALIDFAEAFPQKLVHTIIMETGGMKGRREELNRKQVHQILADNFELQQIHSEYGMTELLSQAYSKENGIFNCSNTMKIVLRKEDDPLQIITANSITKNKETGAINIIDLANIFSCSFIATDDAGILYKDGSFEITGRLENSDIRGCGLMIAE